MVGGWWEKTTKAFSSGPTWQQANRGNEWSKCTFEKREVSKLLAQNRANTLECAGDRQNDLNQHNSGGPV